MPFKSEMYLDPEVISGTILNFLGSALLFWREKPVHCRVYWGQLCHKTMEYKYWMTELTASPPGPETFVVGRGDGYTIQVSLVDKPVGTRMDDFDTSRVSDLASAYASVKNGDLNSAMPEDRSWHPAPQGFGGPGYDAGHTSNTYAWWLLNGSAMSKAAMPAMPPGAIGWGNAPMFPGSTMTRS